MIYDVLPGLDLYCTDPSQHFTTAGSSLDDLDHDLDHDLFDVWRILRPPGCVLTTGNGSRVVSENGASLEFHIRIFGKYCTWKARTRTTLTLSHCVTSTFSELPTALPFPYVHQYNTIIYIYKKDVADAETINEGYLKTITQRRRWSNLWFSCLELNFG